MNRIFTTLFVFFLFGQAHAQYYIRGEIKDQFDAPVQNVRIYFPSTKNIYYSGISGGFGIPSSSLSDSIILEKNGYAPMAFKIKTAEYQHLVLRRIVGTENAQKNRLVSITSGLEGNLNPTSFYRGESYSALIENSFIKTGNNKTTFSMRIDKASYSNIRRFVNQNTKIPPDAVRIDEMLNYFNFNYKEPKGDETFNIESQLTDCPWNADHRLVFLNVSAKKLNLENVPPSNLVFLIDVSGSMDLPNRLPLLKESFQLLIKNLRVQDTVSIVVYGGTVGVWLLPTSGAEKEKISKSIEDLTASGDTPGESALRSAYELAKSTFMKDGNNRIILATDGDFNVGQTSEKELEDLITKEKESGVLLTCLGVGMGNYKDSKIEILAKKGNGNFAYIDDIREAEKILVTEFTQTLYSVASDVSISINFNQNVIDEYRLIGFDNKKSVLEKKETELEGGEIGSGSVNTIMFEIIPSPNSDLKSDIAQLSINYRLPGNSADHKVNYDVSGKNYVPFPQLDSNLRFATSVAMFGLKLRGSEYFPDTVDWDVLKKMAVSATSPDDFLKKQFIELLDKSKVIYYEKKKKKNKKDKL